MSDWISINNDMPKYKQKCLICMPVCGDYKVEGGIYVGHGVWGGTWCSSRGLKQPYKVSHWMPMPELPEFISE